MDNNRTFLRQLLRPYRLRLGVLSVLMMAQSFLQVTMALLTRFVIDTAITGNEKLPLWAGLLVADLLLQIGLYALLSWYTGSTFDRMAAALRTRVLKSAVYSMDSRLQEFHSGVLLNRCMEDVNAICDGVVHAMPTILGQLMRLTGAFAAVALINYPVALVLLGAGVAVAIAVSVLRPVLKAQHRAVRNAEEK